MRKEFLSLEAFSGLTTERLLAYYKKVLTPKNGKYAWCKAGCWDCFDCEARKQAFDLRPQVKALLDGREHVEHKRDKGPRRK